MAAAVIVGWKCLRSVGWSARWLMRFSSRGDASDGRDIFAIAFRIIFQSLTMAMEDGMTRCRVKRGTKRPEHFLPVSSPRQRPCKRCTKVEMEAVTVAQCEMTWCT